MNAVEITGMAASFSLLSGWRLYACVAIAGLAMRFHLIDPPSNIPSLEAFANPWVIGVASVGALAELLADKVMWLDSLWDAVHTFIRIPAGAALAASVFGDSTAAAALAAAILGGSLAAGSHLAKAGSRAVINTSPEPFSNWAASFGEDLAVGTLLWLAFAHPIAALIVVAVLVVLMVWLIPKLWRFIRRLFGRLSGASGASMR